jgi:hypothetical protein
MLLVYRWTRDGYTVVLTATLGDRGRAELLDVIELDVAKLFGDEADE